MTVRVKLIALEQLIKDCWNNAEVATASVIDQKHPSPSEEEITEVVARK